MSDAAGNDIAASLSHLSLLSQPKPATPTPGLPRLADSHPTPSPPTQPPGSSTHQPTPSPPPQLPGSSTHQPTAPCMTALPQGPSQLLGGAPATPAGPHPQEQAAARLGGPCAADPTSLSGDASAETVVEAGTAGVLVSVANAGVAGAGVALQAMRELIGGCCCMAPPGCGKTLLVRTVAAEYGAVVHELTAASVFGAYVGESERKLRAVFEAAQADADAGRVAVVFLDEVDTLCPRRDGQRQQETRIVAQLLTLLDGATSTQPPPLPQQQQQHQQQQTPTRATDHLPSTRHTHHSSSAAHPGRGCPAGHLVVVAATNRPNAIDPALRRPGRLDREVLVCVPGLADREAILRLHTQGLVLAAGVDLAALATACHGYSGADLAALAREAAMGALTLAASVMLTDPSADIDAVPVLPITPADFASALKRVGPSIVRGAEADIKPVLWEDVGGLQSVKLRLQQAVEWPLRHRDAFERMGLTPPRGVLLHGPPGCSKTTLARAAATASGATLLPLSCAQLYSMYVGEGEALLRDTFGRARMAAPSIIFLDEVDAVAASRSQVSGGGAGGQGGGGADAGLRLLSTLLTEMDGMELATGVLVLAATNRPFAIDAALMRPGRFDAVLYVPPPDAEGRAQILRVHTRGMPLAADVDLDLLACDATECMTGAELAGVCREAAMAAVREDMQFASEVAMRHFSQALASTRPSLTPELLDRYESWGQ
ncbi:MAG: hypothetical protein WDW36_005234 [Sanguina aurantia]